MLIPFVIDRDSLVIEPDCSASQYVVSQQLVQEITGHFGLLLYDTDRFETSSVNNAVQKLPHRGVRHLWAQALKHLPKTPIGGCWDGTVCRQSVTVLEDGNALLALVDDTTAVGEFDFTPEQLSRRFGSQSLVEVCRLHAAPVCERFQEAKGLAGRPINLKDAHQSVWDMRFAGLVSAPIKSVVVVDRYAVSRAFELGRESGLERLLLRIDATARSPKYVTVFSAWTNTLKGISLADIVRGMEDEWERLRYVEQLTIWMSHSDVFGRLSHDRYIRFGQFHVWDVGLGLKIFEGPEVGERSSATFKAGSVVAEEYRIVENQLRQSKGVKTEKLSR
jgi:hypothetical protein